MKTGALAVLFVITISCSFAQIQFEKGYFIDLNNQKTECLIKNIDWENNPYKFEYKITDESDVQQADTSSVTEFGVYNFSKYVRADVKIDRSPKELSDLSSDSGPLFSKERLFLKVVIEGAASLYYYKDKSIGRFFYNVDGLPVEQLIYKEYLDKDNNVRANASFRHQLWEKVNCSNTSFNSFKHIGYYKDELKKHFKIYNECKGSAIIDFSNKKKNDFFNLKVAPGLDYSWVATYNSTIPDKNIDFDKKLTVRLSLEAEFILPFNKRKWGILVAPTYQYFNSLSYFNPQNNLVINDRPIEVTFRSIEFPVGLRHYFFLTKDSKLFINALAVPPIIIDLGSTVILDHTQELKVSSSGNFALGAGMEFKKISAEIRYRTKRNILSDYHYWQSYYSGLSFIIGYKVF